MNSVQATWIESSKKRSMLCFKMEVKNVQAHLYQSYCKMLFVALYTGQCMIVVEKTGWNILCLHSLHCKVEKIRPVLTSKG